MMSEIAKTISDGSVLSLIEKFLKSGVMIAGAYESTEVGSPQGGVISPLISGIYLNIFDQKIKSNSNYRMVRYADDILLFARSKREAGNALTWATEILEEELKLTVNKTKTKITSLDNGVFFLGFTIYRKYVTIEQKRVKRFKDKIRQLTKRNSGIPIERTGWVTL